MNKERILLSLLCVLLLLLLGGGLYWTFGDDASTPVREEAPADPAALTYMGNTLSEEQDGKKIWELTAAVIEIDVQTRNTILKDISGSFYQANGDVVTIRAPLAEYNVESKDIMIREKATAESSDGAVLVADQLIWAGEQRLFSGEGNVRLTRGDIVITGDTLTSDRDFRKFKMTGNAQITQGGTGQ